MKRYILILILILLVISDKLAGQPVAVPTSNSPVCTGTTINLFGAPDGMAIYTWTGPNGFTSTLQNPTIPNAASENAGTYTLVVNNGTENSPPATTVVVVNVLPVATASSNSPVCEGGTITLTGGPDGMTSYSWTGPNGFTSSLQSPSIAGATTSDAGNYSLTVNNGTCSSTSVSTSVTVNAKPVASPSSNSPVCEGSSINLTGGPNGMNTYSWTGPDGFTSSSQNPSIPGSAAANAGDYLLTVNDGTCTSDAVTVTVVINTMPAASASSNSPVCAGATINLSGGPDGMASYSWTGPDGFSSSLQNPSIPGSTTAMTGTYSLIVTNGACTTAPVTTDVVVNALPSASASSNSPVCTGSAINLTGGPGGMSTYTWSGPDGFNSSSQNPSIGSATLAKAGTYSLTVKDANNCTSSPATVNVVVNQVPAINNMTVTSGDGEPFTATPIDGTNGVVPSGTVYTWSVPTMDPGITGGQAATDQSNIHGTLYSSKSDIRHAIYTVTSKNAGCVHTDDFTVTVNVNPKARINSKTAAICSGSTFTVLPVDGVDGDIVPASTTYRWSAPSGSGISGGTAETNQTDIHGTLNNTTSTVRTATYNVTPTSGGLDGQVFTVTVTVNPTPTLSGASLAAQVCDGEYATIILSGLLPNSTSTIDFSINSVPQTAITGKIADGSGNASFTTRTLTSADNGLTLRITSVTETSHTPNCPKLFTLDVTLIVNPLPTLTGASLATTTCDGTGATINLTGLRTGSTSTIDYQLEGDATTYHATGVTSDSPAFVTVPLSLSDNGRKLSIIGITTTSSPSNCYTAAPFELTLIVNPIPVPVIAGPGIVCENTTGKVYTTEAGKTGYDWEIPAGATFTGDGTNSISVNWGAAGSRTVTVTYSAFGCPAASPSVYNVSVNALPVPSITGPVTACAGSTGNVYATESNMTDYTWTVSGGTYTGSGNLILVTWTDVGSGKSVAVNYKNPGGCYASTPTSYGVTVYPVPSLSSTLTPTAICSGSAFSYTPESTTTGATFSWSRAAVSGISQSANSGTGNVNEVLTNLTTVPINVTYSFTTSANGCSSTPQNVIVTVKPMPQLNSTLAPTAICSGTTFSYTPESNTSGSSFSWTRLTITGISESGTTGSGSVSEALTNSTADPVNVTYSYITTANGCSHTPQDVVVTVNPKPVLTSTLTPAAICSGTTFSYVPVCPTAGTSLGWSRSSVAGISQPGSAGTGNISEILTNTTSGPVIVTYVYNLTANGCSNPQNVAFTVNPLPVPAISGPATPNVNTTGNIYSTETLMSGYSWTVSAGGSITGGSGTNSITVDWTGSGTQTVSVNYTSSDLCTAVSPVSYNVTVNALPEARNVSIIGNVRSGVTLYGSYVYYDADGNSEGTSSYKWYTGTSSGGAGSAEIPAAVSSSFKLTDAQIGKFIGFSVQPAALAGATPGNIYTSPVWVGPVINDPPVATILPVSGSLNVNTLLTGHYLYSDTEGDLESGTTFEWYSSDNEFGTYTKIDDGISHLISMDEQGDYFKIYITPHAASGTPTGTQVVSAVAGPANSRPTASAVTVDGTTTIGSTLTGDYVYNDVDPADSEGTSTFRWLRSGTVPIPGATGQTYVITPDDEGYGIAFEVTPVSTPGYPGAGIPVMSAQTAEVTDPSSLTPAASEVCIEGIRAAGQTLRGKYLYTFYKSEGTSLYQWYRNGVPIAGATGIQYTLKQVEDIDSKASITFRVSPRSSNEPPKVGAGVMSNPLAIITLSKDQYSVSEADDTIKVNVSGGVFSGTGVTGNIFSPSSAGPSGPTPYTISYLLNIVNTAHNCSQQASQQVIVNPNVSSFDGFDDLYCHDRGPDTITVTGVPAGSTDLKFTITNPKGIISSSGTTVTIDPGRMRPGNGKDKLSFSYRYLGIFYQISKSFVIDSVSTGIRILNLDTTYCQGDSKKYITIEGIYPLGGTAEWYGDILTDMKPGSAYADPAIGLPDKTYPVSYRYRSPAGCFSKVLTAKVTINPLPDPLFTLNDTYNIDGGPVTLMANQAGGIFSGRGVSGINLFPDIAGLGEDEIKYSITDGNKCSASYAKKTIIRQALGSITDIPSIICYDDTTFRARVTSLPSTGVIVITGFWSYKNKLAYAGGITADYNVPAAGAGADTLYFTYKWDGVDYSVTKPILVDKLDQVIIKNLNAGDTICNDRQRFELTPSIYGGIFTGPVSGGFLDPLKATRADTVNYTYTNPETGCKTSTSVPVNVFPAPRVSFSPADVCIENNTDATIFENLTTSNDTIKSWLWKFTDIDGEHPGYDSVGRYLYTTGGIKKVTLTATTFTGCYVKVDSTFNLGIRPEGAFYVKRDCYQLNDNLILVDTTVSSSPITNRSWRIFNGAEFSTASKQAVYPKTDTGFIKIEYIVKTSYLNCIDTVIRDVYIRPTITIPPDGYFENFEAGKKGWVKGETSANSWSFGTPDRQIINSAYSGSKAWFTRISQPHSSAESSSIISPCFDFSTTERPLIKLGLFRYFEKEKDGAALQYRIGDSKDWQYVGTINDGIQWYNSAVIRGEPGGNQLGWTTMGDPDSIWVDAIHALDALKGQKDVRFRIAYGSDGSYSNSEGIAIDDIWIGERSRNVLLEHFTNNSDNSSKQANLVITRIAENRPEDVINIQYHTNFPGTDPYYNENPADAGARILFYGLIKAPYTFIDGGTNINFANTFDNPVRIDSNDVTRRSLIPARFGIVLTPDISGGILTVSGKITALETLNSDNLTLFIAVTEKQNSDHAGANGETVYYNVFRKFIPDAGGINLKKSWTKGELFTIPEQTWLIENIKNLADIEVIAFIQNNITKELYQAESEIEKKVAVGIERLFSDRANNFALYPNPAVNNLTVTFGKPLARDADIRIYNIQGIVISEYKAGSGSREFFIEDTGLKGGIYLVRVTSGSVDYGFRKLIVTRD